MSVPMMDLPSALEEVSVLVLREAGEQRRFESADALAWWQDSLSASTVLDRQQMLQSPPSAWLRELWECATRSDREAAISELAETVGAEVSSRPLLAGDVAFLKRISLDESAHPWERHAALRSLTFIAEDLPRWRPEVMAVLLQAIDSPRSGIRSVAIDSLRHLDERDPSLIARLAILSEEDPSDFVRESARLAHRILQD